MESLVDCTGLSRAGLVLALLNHAISLERTGDPALPGGEEVAYIQGTVEGDVLSVECAAGRHIGARFVRWPFVCPGSYDRKYGSGSMARVVAAAARGKLQRRFLNRREIDWAL